MSVHGRMLPATLAAALTIGILSAAWASDDHEHAHELQQQGKILPLEDIMKKLPLEAGRVLEVELENEHGQYVYEIEVLNSRGQVNEYLFDAANGSLLGVEEDD